MKRRASAIDCETLAADIAGLSKLSIDELRERWKAMYGRAPSGEIGRSFLTRAIAYRLLEQAYCGLKPSTRRLLARVAEGTATGSSTQKLQIRKAQSGNCSIGQVPKIENEARLFNDYNCPFIGYHYTGAQDVLFSNQ